MLCGSVTMTPYKQWRRNEFKSGGTAKVGDRSGSKRRKFFVLVVPLHVFGSKSTTSRFGERFREVSTVWSVSCLLFFYSRCPRAL